MVMNNACAEQWKFDPLPSLWLDISIEMIGNFGDTILMLAVVDNGHGMGHVSSVDKIDYLRIYATPGLWLQPCRMSVFQLCGKWKDDRERELVASATSTSAYRSWINVSKDARISYEKFQAIMKTGTHWRKASLRVIPLTSVSKPQLKINQIKDRVMLNNFQGKKQEVEDHRRITMPRVVPVSTREPKRVVKPA
nr:hypothetical protein [Tanacetum cinerariifolium]